MEEEENSLFDLQNMDSSFDGLNTFIIPAKTHLTYPYVCNVCRKAIHDPRDEEPHRVLHAVSLFTTCVHCGMKKETKKSFVRYTDPSNNTTNFYCKACAAQTEVVSKLDLCKKREFYTCGRCSYKTPNKTHLLDHINSHSGDKPHICDFCGIGFSYAVSLKTHLRTHTGEKPHICNECGRTFRRSYHLQRHAMIHSGRKPYQCTHCGLFFRQSNTLKFHLQTHTGVKPHTCDLCERSFCDRRSLKKHIESSHTGIPVKTQSEPLTQPIPEPLNPSNFILISSDLTNTANKYDTQLIQTQGAQENISN